MVAIDATMLMLLLQPDAGAPTGPGGAPVERAADRVRHLVAELGARGDTVLIPTPALAEVLVRVSARDAERLVERLDQYWVFRVEPFDRRAAVEVAAMTRDALDRRDEKDGVSAPWAKVKYDRQIVAIATVNRATVIYSDDDDVRRIAVRANMEVVRVADLPLPDPKAEQGARDEVQSPQLDWLQEE